MKKIIQELNKIKDVKNVKRTTENKLKINLFSKELPHTEAKQIKGDLRKTSQKIRSKLEKSNIQTWQWVQKPKKKYQKTQIDTEKIKDRKPVGHEPDYYIIYIKR